MRIKDEILYKAAASPVSIPFRTVLMSRFLHFSLASADFFFFWTDSGLGKLVTELYSQQPSLFMMYPCLSNVFPKRAVQSEYYQEAVFNDRKANYNQMTTQGTEPQ